MRIRSVALGICVAVAAAAAPADSETSPDVRETVRKGVAFLLSTQNPDGSWGTFRTERSYELMCGVPGSHQAFRVATTALGVRALLGCARMDDPAVWAAIDRGVTCLVQNGAVKKANEDEMYNVWSLAYSLRALSRAYWAQPLRKRKPEIAAEVKKLIRAMAESQSATGGWGYYTFEMPNPVWSTSFTTATGVLALQEARECGFAVPDEVLRRGLRLIEKMRSPEGSYRYSFDHLYHPQGMINRTIGSLARTPACDMALYRGKSETVNTDVLARNLKAFFDHRQYLKNGVARPIPHETWYQISGYFHLYGHAYAGEAIAALPTPERERFAAELEKALASDQRPDGCWWDYPIYSYHKPYGTAYALIGLSQAFGDKIR